MANFAFATVDSVPATPGFASIAPSGFNGFPFTIPRVTAGDVGPGTAYPIGLSRQLAAYAYWKVKTWRVEISFSSYWAEPGMPYPHNESYFVTAGENDGTIATPTTEKDLIYPPRETTGGSNQSTSNFWMWINRLVGGTDYYAVEYNDKIYPWMIMDVEVPDGPGTEWTSVAGGTLNFLGEVITIYTDGSTGWAGSIEITMAEEWPWA